MKIIIKKLYNNQDDMLKAIQTVVKKRNKLELKKKEVLYVIEKILENKKSESFKSAIKQKNKRKEELSSISSLAKKGFIELKDDVVYYDNIKTKLKGETNETSKKIGENINEKNNHL